eukprot:130753_1
MIFSLPRQLCSLLLASSILSWSCESFAPRPPPQRKVIVTGAAGRTGKLVFSSLLKQESFYPMGLVKSEKSAKKIIKDNAECGLENVWICDVTELDSDNESSLPNGIRDSDAMIICTSAVPKLRKRHLAKALLKAPINMLAGKKPLDFKTLQFHFAPGQHPEKVDYEGQIAQIDLAKKLGVSHVVLVSSMGGTNPDDFLNTLGKDKDGNGDGDILLWKRKAEKYLVESGLQYTIIHPGGLKDTPGGISELWLDVDDNIMMSPSRHMISRCDVARLCVASLKVSGGQSTSFDCINIDVPEGTKPRPTEIALTEFLDAETVYDYSTDRKLDYSMNI